MNENHQLLADSSEPLTVSLGDVFNYFKNQTKAITATVVASIVVAVVAYTKAAEDAPYSVLDGMVSLVILIVLCAIAFYGVAVVSRKNENDSNFAAVWAIAPFYFSIVGSGQGVFIEGFLLVVGRVWQTETVAAAAAFRGGIAMLIMNVSVLSDAFMVFGDGKHTTLLTYMAYFLITVGSFCGAAVFYSDLHGEFGVKGPGKSFGGLCTVGLTAVSFLVIAIKGCTYGGQKARILLALSKLTTIVGLLVFVPSDSLSNTMIYHTIRTVGIYISIIPYHLANVESPGFANRAEADIPPSTIVLLVLIGIFAWVAGANAF